MAVPATMPVALLLILVCVLAATLRHGMPWNYLASRDIHEAAFRVPSTPFIRFITAPGWLLALLVVVPMAAGYFARGQWSLLPWVGFASHVQYQGIWDALGTAIAVACADVWLFFGVAVFAGRQEYQRLKRDGEGRDVNREWLMLELAIWRAKRKYYLAINVLAGLLLTTPYNPVYRLLDRLPLPERCSLPGLC